MAMTLTQLALAAILTEKLWESLKLIWEKKKLSIDRVGALVLGITIALGTGIDLFATVGLPINIPYLGLILTGIIISRGANFIHDLFKITEEVKVKRKAENGKFKNLSLQ